MVIHVKAVFVKDESKEEIPFNGGMHSIEGIFISMTLRKHLLLNDNLHIGLRNGICTVPMESTQENLDVIKNIYEDSVGMEFQTPSHLRFNVINMPDAGIEREVVNHWNFICECGCKLEFVGFTPGLDIYVDDHWIIAQDKMKDYCWEDYLPKDRHETWFTLKDEIIKMYQEEYLNGAPHTEIWLHLYNYYVNVENDPIPLNGRLTYENAF